MATLAQTVSVLVVDDNPGVRATAVDMFRALGFAVYDAYNGADALNMLAAHRDIALLFADVRMPGMSGTELAEEARRRCPNIMVVLTSGYIDGSPIKNVPFLRKPYRVSELAALVLPAPGAGAGDESRQ
jgi:CheY-like chemotaxis protein